MCYFLQLQKEKGKDILALINSDCKVNAITLIYTAKLGLKVQKTDIDTQKINNTSLETYGMAITAFQIFNKLDQTWFSKEAFLLVDISMKMVFDITYLTFNNADV